MKKAIIKRVISFVLAVIMVALIVPCGVISSFAAETVNLTADPEQMLGLGFNAITNSSISTGTLITRPWLDMSNDDLTTYVFGKTGGDGVLEQSSNSWYAKSSLELMQKFGIDYTNTKSAKFSISKIKAGVSSKFNVGVDFSKTTTTSELYYYYAYTAVCNRYTLGADYSNYLNKDFLEAVDKININSDASIASFFNTYGTHMLTSFETGGELSLTAWAYSSSENTEILADLEQETSANAGAGTIFDVSKNSKLVLSFSSNRTDAEVTSGTRMEAIGGNSVYVDVSNPETLEMDTEDVKKWVSAVSENPAFIPASSEWVPVWDVLPKDEKYSALRDALYEYFIAHTENDNQEFLQKYCSFENRVTVNGYTYISKDGYVSQNVAYAQDGQNYVAPGSTLIIAESIADSIFSLDSISYDINSDLSSKRNGADIFEIDRNGVIKVKSNAQDGDTIVMNIKAGDLVIKRVKFTVKLENVLSGGYGTEERPYLIGGPQDITMLMNKALPVDYVQYYFALTKDIDMKGAVLPGIEQFCGVLDGCGYHIYNFVLDVPVNSIHGGFIRYLSSKNGIMGIVRNLTLGKDGVSAYDGYSIKAQHLAGENLTLQRFGTLVGLNFGIVDNCHVENAYIETWIKDKKDGQSIHAFIGGLVGDNDRIITRSSVSNSLIEPFADNVRPSDVSEVLFVGGLCGNNCAYILHNNCAYILQSLVCDTTITVKLVNDRLLTSSSAYVGGLVGRASISGDSCINNCVTFNNELTANIDAKKYPCAFALVGACLGLSNETEYCMGLVYTADTKYPLVGKGCDDGSAKFSNVNTLISNMSGGFEHFTTVSGKPQIKQITTLQVSEGLPEYVIGDYVDVLDLKVVGYYADGTQYKQYNRSTDTYETQYFTRFKIANFSTGQATNSNQMAAATITAYGGISGTYTFSVAKEMVQKLELIQAPYQTSYYLGDALNPFGISFRLTYNNGKMETVNEGYTLRGFDPNLTGEQTVTLLYGDFSDTFKVVVYRVKPDRILISRQPNKTSYAVGEKLDVTGLEVTLVNNDGSMQSLSIADVTCSVLNSANEGGQDITVTYTYFDEDDKKNVNLTSSFAVNVGSILSIGIDTLPKRTSYFTSDLGPDKAGLSVKVNYSNGVSKTVGADAVTLSGYDMSRVGQQRVTVSYQGFTTTYDIVVEAVTLQEVAVVQSPQTSFFVGDTLNTYGLCLELRYNDGSTRVVYDGYTIQMQGQAEGALPTFTRNGTMPVTVYYTENNARKSTSYNVTVSAIEITELQIAQKPIKVRYKQGDKINTNGMIVYIVYNNGQVRELADSEYVVPAVSLDEAGQKTITVWYEGTYSASFEVNVVGPERIYVSQTPTKIQYMQGDTFDASGLEISAGYYDFSSVVLSPDEYTVEAPVLTETGETKVTVAYGELETSFNIFVSPFQVPEEAPRIVIDNVNAIIGKTVKVNVALQNNPGIASMKLKVEYDSSVMALTDVSFNSAMGGQFQQPQGMSSPVVLNWYNGTENNAQDLVFATLTFAISSQATPGETSILVTYNAEDIYNIDEENITFYYEEGAIQVIDYLPGDINGDNEINNKDLSRLFQYLSGWDVAVNENAVDVNGDGEANNKDLTRLFQYNSGWDVEIS